MSDCKGNKEVARQLLLDLKCSVCKDVPGFFEFEETDTFVQKVFIWFVKTANLEIVLVDQNLSTMNLLSLLKISWKNLNGITAAISNTAVKI